MNKCKQREQDKKAISDVLSLVGMMLGLVYLVAFSPMLINVTPLFFILNIIVMIVIVMCLDWREKNLFVRKD